MTTVYCGVDFHARQQTICYLTTEDGVLTSQELKHDNKEEVRNFYAQLPRPVQVGLEAGGYSLWFEQLMEELGHEILLGDAAEIRRCARRRQKNDRRDAALILDLLLHNEFPRIHRQTPVSREILRMLRYRHKLVKLRTIVKNSLQAIALQAGLAVKAKLFTQAGLQQLRGLVLPATMQLQREEWLQLLPTLNQRITDCEAWLRQQAVPDQRVLRLQTHPGIGLLTSLAVVHTLDPVSRFPNQRKVAAYAGFDPCEDSSAERKRYLGISKAGSKLLRFLLVEAGQTAVKEDVELKRFYQRLWHRRNKPKAKVAVARKLLIRCYILLRDEIDYAEFQRRAVAARLARQDA
ncbi:MAG: IS110 family transposase [Pyrinomonadaceae bacterium]